ncbi:MAG: hypothetical protein L0216_01130 [Planctomycetales bacterium]|nr:hypothetical protein [Planctomycetales bacterium]
MRANDPLVPGESPRGRREEKRRRKRRLQALEAELNEILDAWDPLGVRPPRGEYACVALPLLGRLEAGATTEQVQDLLAHSLSEHFGVAVPGKRILEMARAIREWHAETRRDVEGFEDAGAPSLGPGVPVGCLAWVGLGAFMALGLDELQAASRWVGLALWIEAEQGRRGIHWVIACGWIVLLAWATALVVSPVAFIVLRRGRAVAATLLIAAVTGAAAGTVAKAVAVALLVWMDYVRTSWMPLGWRTTSITALAPALGGTVIGLLLLARARQALACGSPATADPSPLPEPTRPPSVGPPTPAGDP